VKDSITENTMANAFENRLVQWRNRLQASPAGKFSHWWFKELHQALPAKWQEKLQHALRRVTLGFENGVLRIGVEENGLINPLEEFSTKQDSPLVQHQINDLLAQNELLEVPRIYLLEASQILHKELLLPEAAGANLPQVLTFEMDRQTPFRAKDVYFGWKVSSRDKDSGQIRVDLFVTPRSEVDSMREALAARGLAPSGVDIVENGKTLGLNLLPVDKRVRVVNRKVRLNYGLAAFALVLLVMVMSQSLYLRAHQVQELEAAIEQVQDEARMVQGIRDRIKDTGEAASFLTQRRSEYPMAIKVLADITDFLPNDTYLDRLVIGQSSVQLQGKSQNAQQLIELVNESELFDDAAFRGSTRLDARTGMEIFEVNAEIIKEGEG
jgi:general secretion pathway protein L